MILARIICVDDHVLFLQGVKSGLSKYAFLEIVYLAQDGLKLLEYLKEHNLPDIILLDLHMPIMDGYETLNHLKNLYPTVKVIILSMNNDFSIIRKMRENGADGYLTKEVDFAEMLLALGAVMDGNRFFPQLKRIDYLQ